MFVFIQQVSHSHPAHVPFLVKSPLTCPDFANLSAERRHVFISKSVIFKKDRTSKQKLVKEAFKLPLADRELVTETGLSCGSFLTG